MRAAPIPRGKAGDVDRLDYPPLRQSLRSGQIHDVNIRSDGHPPSSLSFQQTTEEEEETPRTPINQPCQKEKREDQQPPSNESVDSPTLRRLRWHMGRTPGPLLPNDDLYGGEPWIQVSHELHGFHHIGRSRSPSPCPAKREAPRWVFGVQKDLEGEVGGEEVSYVSGTLYTHSDAHQPTVLPSPTSRSVPLQRTVLPRVLQEEEEKRLLTPLWPTDAHQPTVPGIMSKEDGLLQVLIPLYAAFERGDIERKGRVTAEDIRWTFLYDEQTLYLFGLERVNPSTPVPPSFIERIKSLSTLCHKPPPCLLRTAQDSTTRRKKPVKSTVTPPSYISDWNPLASWKDSWVTNVVELVTACHTGGPGVLCQRARESLQKSALRLFGADPVNVIALVPSAEKRRKKMLAALRRLNTLAIHRFRAEDSPPTFSFAEYANTFYRFLPSAPYEKKHPWLGRGRKDESEGRRRGLPPTVERMARDGRLGVGLTAFDVAPMKRLLWPRGGIGIEPPSCTLGPRRLAGKTRVKDDTPPLSPLSVERNTNDDSVPRTIQKVENDAHVEEKMWNLQVEKHRLQSDIDHFNTSRYIDLMNHPPLAPSSVVMGGEKKVVRTEPSPVFDRRQRLPLPMHPFDVTDPQLPFCPPWTSQGERRRGEERFQRKIKSPRRHLSSSSSFEEEKRLRSGWRRSSDEDDIQRIKKMLTREPTGLLTGDAPFHSLFRDSWEKTSDEASKFITT